MLHTVSYLCPCCAQAEQQSTEFRIKALGKALEYKDLEVVFPVCLMLCHMVSAEDLNGLSQPLVLTKKQRQTTPDNAGYPKR